VPFDHLNQRFINIKKFDFSVDQEAESDFKVTFDNLKHCFFDFIQLTFCTSQEAINEIAVICNV